MLLGTKALPQTQKVNINLMSLHLPADHLEYGVEVMAA